MDLAQSVDQYCERLGPDFWAEPLNAVSNAAFLVAALVALRAWQRRGGGDLPVLALIGLVFAIAAGSFAFHTLATRGASLLDVIPISLFILGYFLLAMRRFLGLAPWLAVLATAGLFAANALAAGLEISWLGSSVGYVPALAAIFAVGLAMLRRDGRVARGLFSAGALFAVSLTFRTLDEPMCQAFPIGTHFMWHVLNATVLAMLLAVALRARRPAARTLSRE